MTSWWKFWETKPAPNKNPDGVKWRWATFDPLPEITTFELAWIVSRGGAASLVPDGFDVGPHFIVKDLAGSYWDEYQLAPSPEDAWGVRFPDDHRPRRYS